MSEQPDEPTPEQPRGVGHLDLARAVVVTLVFVVLTVWLLADQSQSPKASSASTSTTTTTAHAGSTTTSSGSHTTATTIPRSQVKVQVANGSTTAGVATRITQQLQTLGWNTLPPVNASSQVTASVVYYAANRRAQALEIASELNLAATAAQPLTTSVPVAGAAGDDVVVVVGPDLASS
jgi:hypothetical protein